jgi:transcription elongation factor Elf1
MSSIVFDCPHCITKQIALTIVHAIAKSAITGWAFLHCPNCDHPSCAFVVKRGHNSTLDYNDAIRQNNSLNSYGFEVAQIWPAKPSPKIPEFLPASVERVMQQAETNFLQPNHEDASSTMYRKALELGLKIIDSSLKGTLARRIELLGESGKLTPDLVKWAKEIKNLGNDGAHDDQPISRDELEALRGLTDMVFRYLFTLPAMLAERKKDNAEVAAT